MSSIEGVPQESAVPLSFAQQRLWMLDQLGADRFAFNISAAVRLIGMLRWVALEQGLDEIVRRHDALRTTFAVIDGQPVQVIAPDLRIPLSVVDLREWPETEREAQARRLVREQAQQPFGLTKGPLMRIVLLRLQEADHFLLLTLHHLIADEESVEVLLAEWATLYQAFSTGSLSPLSGPPVQYADYAAWQRRWLQGDELERRLVYWEQRLEGAPAVLKLPTDRPRPLIQTFNGARQSVVLPGALTVRLEELSQRARVTLFMTLLAAFKILLHRYTEQTDIVVGSPVADRDRAETARLVGCLANALVLRTDLGGNPTFHELLGRVRETTLGAFAHQDLAFEKLIEALQPERDMSYSPLFQVAFVLRDVPQALAPFWELDTARLAVDRGISRYDLSLELEKTGQDLTGGIEYNTDLFRGETIVRLGEHFECLLEGIVAHPEARLSDLPLLTKAERQRILVTWNENRRTYPSGHCLHELFERQAARTPDAVALVYQGQALTYAKLDARANQLAHYLGKLGMGPEVLAGLCVERSVELVVGILGIWKAGGAYVPMDPQYPLERLAMLLEDARPAVLLTQVWALTRLPDYDGPVVCLDADETIIAQESEGRLESRVLPEHLAYVIYTSGSTGRPKGVLITHANVCPLLHWGYDVLGLTGEDRSVQYLSYSFDWSVWEMLIALTTGGSLCLLTREEVLSPEKTIGFMEENAITIWHATPTQYQIVMGEGQKLATLRHACIGAEKLTSELVERCLEELDEECRLYNMYGPTEAAIMATTLDIDRESLGTYRELSSVPIGPPLANARCYVLDRYDHVQPVGVPGELFISGDGLARGYLGRPELTAERFVPHPFRAGERLYKTGDLVRWLPEGSLEYLGRIDQQIKLRGYRIELGEIEAALTQHPAVREAAVVVRNAEGAPGDPRLVAYVVARDGQGGVVGELRRWVQDKLPEYMVPSAFVVLEALPQTSSGKLDRRALPAPEPIRPELSEIFVAPRTLVEEMVAGLWCQVLGLERVGIHDNFFELGGHSLLATQVLSRIRHTFQVELPLRDLFEAPTVAGLAGHIENMQRAGRNLPIPPIVPAARDRDLPLSFAQQRLWFLDQLEPGNLAYNLPEAIRMTGRLNRAALEHSLDEIVRRHEALRTHLITVDGRPVQVIESSLPIALPEVELRDLPGGERENEVQRLIAKETQRPFDLARDPLLRVTLLRLDEQEHLLLLTLHHIVSDGWSRGVFNRELATLYAAFSAGQPSPLAELPIQYADFAVWQREWLQGQVLETQLAYWQQQLEGSLPVLELPTDHLRPAVQTYRGMHQPWELADTLTKSLKALSQREGVTLFMTLLAAFQTLLHRYTGQVDISVGTPIANRNRSEWEGLIGFFVNTLVMRTDLTGDPSFCDALMQVREVTLDAYAHQDLPLEKLVEVLRPERSSSHSPLFQVLFVLENAPMQSLELPGLTLSFMQVETGAVKFDLALTIEESAQGLSGFMGYNTDLFESTTIQRMICHFQALLAGVVAHPEARLSDLPLLSEGERRQLLMEWSTSGGDYRVKETLPELLAAQVERTLDGVAVVSEAAHLTYQALNRRANQLAHYLRRLGVGPDDLVGLCVGRTLELVVGLVGILKAGGGYVPLDPTYPKERLAFILEDAGLSVLLTQASLAARLPEPDERARRVCLDSEGERIAAERESGPISGVRPDHLAYVIYTSGSTGRPKGVLITHENVIPVLRWSQEYLGLGQHSRVLQNLNPCFDFGVFELLTTMLFGGTLCFLDEGWREELGGYEEHIREQRINTIHSTPSFFRQIALASEKLETLDVVHLGGEALSRTIVEDIERVVGEGCVIYNGYGPTEASVNSCIFRVGGKARDESGEWSSLPIGQASANNVVYVLDGHGQPAPIRVPGELYVGGPGLARGYLKRAELTADRFVPNPYSQRPGERLYRTGDRVRYRADGNIEFLGRMDWQVKLRGFRIELGEIEARLREHAGLQEAVVQAREDTPGESRLVAYIIPNRQPAPTTSELRAFLQAKLPEYMLPFAFVELEHLPLTPSGKVNYRALPAPERDRPELDAAYVEPRTPLEHVLADMWREVLGIERVGIRDSFFELGGDSLRAAILINRLQKEMNQVVYVVVLFDAPTIADFAAYLTLHYAASVAKLCRTRFPVEAHVERGAEAGEAVGIDATKIETMRRQVASRHVPDEHAPTVKNPSALFILSAARSGSTLLRVMLAGHPRLFSPPELALLSFGSLAERKAAFSSRDSGWLEGLLRAIMQIKGCDLERARQIVRQAEDGQIRTQEFYRTMQGWIGEKLLVDKTTTYALDLRTLERAEAYFENARYIHLVRHPAAMIQSYMDSKLDQVFGYGYPYSVREKAELFWLISNQNILEFLEHVPLRRQYFLRFEELVQDPRGVMEALCQFLGVDYEPEMLEPYRGDKMTDAVHPESRMVGDPRFHTHDKIESDAGRKWQTLPSGDSLSQPTLELAGRLGYTIESGVAPSGSERSADLRPRPRDSEVPLSFAQQRLWFLDQLTPGSTVYNMASAHRLRGRVNVEALGKSFDEIVRRHQVLRTAFVVREGRPVQVIAASMSLALPLVDLGALAERDREAEAHRLSAEEAQCPFDLAHGPLVRTTLLRLGAEEHILLLTMHHIVSDGWSAGIFNRELAILYPAFSIGDPSPLPDLPIQYADYALWQREWLRGEVLETQLAYWKQQLHDLPDRLEFPTDRPRSSVQSFRGECQSLVLSPSLTEALGALSRQEKVTLFMTLLAAFKTLLYRYTGQTDIVIGSPIINRNRAETEWLIGCFLNTLVLRTCVGGNPNFRELLGRVRDVTLGAYAHQDLPFEKLVEELQPERDLSRSPLFDIMINYIPQVTMQIPGLAVSPESPIELESKFAMTLYVEEQQGQLSLQMVYLRSLFSAERIVCMLDQFRYLLEQIVQAPEETIQSFSLVTPGSRRLLPDPGVVLPEPHYELVTEKLVAWANRLPDQVAICQGERAWTYCELASSAQALARYLLVQGLKQGDVVAVFGERSFGLIASMAAALMSGGVLLTIDPNLPIKRQQLLLREAKAQYLLRVDDRQPEGEWLQGLAPLVVLDVDPDDGYMIQAGPKPHFDRMDLPALAGDDAAYVFFTSGTTGVPKGVLGCHKGLAHFIHWQQGVFTIGPQDRCAQLTALSFDVVLRDVFTPLVSGATLCLPEEIGESGPERILPWLERDKISILHGVPTLTQAWLANVPRQVSLSALRWVFLAGEALTDALVRRWREAFPGGGQIVNLYGPTETTLAKCFYLVPSDVLPGVQPVGWPLPETQALVLADNDRLCGIGEPGEIVLRTPFRSLGYINAPEEQHKRFVRNPYREDEGDWVYHTGDRGRYCLDGSLEILGRLDDQVKIRGVRVELNEVAATLARHPAVKSCVVIAQKDSQDQNRIVAYVVASQQDQATASDLRAHLSVELPAAMIPSAFVFLDQLPLTPNGKVDRRALPAPDETRLVSERTFIAPRTPTEEILANIWSQLLDVEQVDIHDDFFELGGHSLLATRVIVRLRDAFHVELPLRSLFEAPTVAGLAERIERATKVERGLQIPPIRRVSRDGELPLSFSQQRMWFLDQFEPGHPTYNIPLAFHFKGLLDIAALERSLNEIVRRHDVLRATFPAVKGRPVQVIAPALRLTLLIVDLTELPDTQRQTQAHGLTAEEARRPFDLALGPLLRTMLLRLGEQEHILTLTVHHIVSDGWSTGVLNKELAALYAAFSTDKPSPLPELSIQYADYAIWQREWLQGQMLAAPLAYWKQRLQGPLPVLRLPADRPQPPVSTGRGSRQFFSLPKMLAEALVALSQREGSTLFMTLLTAFKALLYRYTGQEDIVVGSLIANRNRVEVEGLIGFFVNALILRTDLSGDPTFRELLGRVRQVTLEAYAYQDLPFERLVEELQPERSASRDPLFRVMFVFQNVPRGPSEFPGLTLSRIELNNGTTPSDLYLVMMEDARQGLVGEIAYSTDLFDDATISRILEHYRTLLESVVADPDQPLSTLPPSLVIMPPSLDVRSDLQPGLGSFGDSKDEMARRETRLLERLSRLPAAKRALLEERLRGG